MLKHKVFIVDDHPVMCEGLSQLINNETDLTVCGDAPDISNALQSIPECRPDAAIVDISLRKGSGIRLIEELSISNRNLPVLVLSMHEESIYAERCLKAGAKGYIMKQQSPGEVISALRKILDGEIYVSENLRSTLFNKLITKRFKADTSPVDRLSNRELEVFQLIGQGLQTRQVAGELNLSVKTIETYIEHIKQKMNFKSLHELIIHAIRWLTAGKIL
ncbi:MAG TPA: response regulator transcription factor [Nitrospirae bacterium]|nr:oxygen regulatory protein NreC [bacterium BMS3Abin06]HDH11203.1 response regulator transcription factor [Nitrospirota bacterium]HDZ02444.1 response regulator transcription factor [Nitrospirota bacterium]